MTQDSLRSVESEKLYPRILAVMRRTFRGAAELTNLPPSTAADDIEGWDSLSHAVFIMNLEDEFSVELPINETLEAQNVRELALLIMEALP